RGRFHAYSAGSHPKGEVNPYAIRLLESLHYKTDDLRSKSWDEFEQAEAPKLDFVFTVCDDAAAEMCPIWPGQPMTAHWGLPDPAAAQGSPAEVALAFAGAYRMMMGRLTVFMNLPLASIDKLSLQRRLEAIGDRRDAAAKA
ncbi:MAG TPA: arsenate reductase ArsC, partial [Caulobacteraceae bacterium]|nr:arsenate reductase ArsC [Caulobacteraceae bacterium]